MMISVGYLRVWQFVFCIVALTEVRFVAAQVAPLPSDEVQTQFDLAKPLNWQEACKLIGKNSDSTVADKIEATLREALRSPDRSELMACALILHCVERGNCDAVRAAIAGTRTVFPTASVETQCFLARVRLWLWLTADEPKGADYATTTFRELVTNTHRGALPKPELRAHSQMIGTICGMLEPEMAASPIAADTIKIAEQCLSTSSIADVKSRFKQGQHAAKERALALEQTIEKAKTKMPNEIAEEQEARKAKLSELGYEFTNTRDLMIEIVRNSREVTRQNTLDRRKLADYMKRLMREWMTPTAGHPGPPPVEPRVPVKSEISVREYDEVSKYETRKDADGNRYEVKIGTERKDRSQAAIDRERNEKYARLMAEYQVLKADFDRRIAIYVPLLNSWIETDRMRRVKLQEERAAAEARSKELLETNNQLREEASDVKSEYREQRSEVEILAEEYELTDIALKSVASNSVSSAFRPPYFGLIDVEIEKSQLLGRIKK